MKHMYDLSVGQNSDGDIVISQEISGLSEVDIVISSEQIPVLIKWIDATPSDGDILISQELYGEGDSFLNMYHNAITEVSVVVTKEQIPVLIQWIQEELEAGE